jgi:hypothetical protein
MKPAVKLLLISSFGLLINACNNSSSSKKEGDATTGT